jgi:hypothetical protein
MAITIKRQYYPDTTTVNRGGKNAATSVYIVYDDTGLGVTKEQTYTLSGLPTVGQVHPEISNIFVQSLARQQEGRAVLVTVNYAPISGGTSQRPIVDVLEQNFQSLELSSQDVLVPIPSFRLERRTFKDGEQTVEDKFLWGRNDEEFAVEVNRHTFTAVLSGEFQDGLSLTELFSTFATIRAQQNTLHTFGGDQYLFKPRFLKQRTKSQPAAAGQVAEPARWEVQYTWMYDPGVLNAYGPNGTPGTQSNGLHFRNPVTVGGIPLFTHAYVCQDATFAIRPYQRVQTYPDLANPEAPPKVNFLTPYRSVPSGWQNLPGIS